MNYSLREVIEMWEQDVILVRTINKKDDTGKPIPAEEKKYKIKGSILNQRKGNKLTNLILDNERQSTDILYDIYFLEGMEIVPQVKDIIIWKDKRYLIDKPLEDNTINSDFWKGEIIELSENKGNS